MEHVSGKQDHSLAPVAVDAPSIDDELASLRAGQTRLLWKWGLALAAFAIVGGFTVRGMENADRRDRAWQALGYLNATHLDGFFNCALPRARPVRATSRDHLHSLVERHLQPDAAVFGHQMQDCLHDLAEYQAGLSKMAVPEEVAPEHRAMVRAAGDLYARADKLAEGLRGNSAMDYVKTAGLIDRFTGAYAKLNASRKSWNEAMAF